ncbi:MAG: alanine racemase [Treponemataceae bacterium]|nr:alanine racemase [Treponemataceae bacterium]
MRVTQAIIHLDNFEHNIYQVKNAVPAGTKLCLAIKANAYGHGAAEIARRAVEAGVSVFAVAAVSEGMLLRAAGFTNDILVLSVPGDDEIPALFEEHLTPLVFDTDFIAALESYGKAHSVYINVHLKIDSGMGRVGCYPEDAVKVAQFIRQCTYVRMTGVCTHFAVSDSTVPEHQAFTRHQISEFTGAVENIRESGINPGIVHAASSAALFLYPEARFDMVRPGICAYGYAPDSSVADSLPELKPVMELITHVVAIRSIPKDKSISYGRTWTASEDGDMAILPIGYGDGLPRILSNNLNVTINGTDYPVIGRICMDQCMVYLGKNHGVTVGDKVQVWGPGACNTAETLAAKSGTICYELLCNVNRRVPRIYIG